MVSGNSSNSDSPNVDANNRPNDGASTSALAGASTSDGSSVAAASTFVSSVAGTSSGSATPSADPNRFGRLSNFDHLRAMLFPGRGPLPRGRDRGRGRRGGFAVDGGRGRGRRGGGVGDRVRSEIVLRRPPPRERDYVGPGGRPDYRTMRVGRSYITYHESWRRLRRFLNVGEYGPDRDTRSRRTLRRVAVVSDSDDDLTFPPTPLNSGRYYTAEDLTDPDLVTALLLFVGREAVRYGRVCVLRRQVRLGNVSIEAGQLSLRAFYHLHRALYNLGSTVATRDDIAALHHLGIEIWELTLEIAIDARRTARSTY